MDFSHSDKVRELQERLTQFMDKYVYPAGALPQELEANRPPAIPGR